MFRHSHKTDHPSRNNQRTALGILITLMFFSSPLLAQETQEDSNEKGFYLGIRFIGSSLHVDDSEDADFFIKDDGGGAQLQAGYRFNNAFSLELSMGGAKHDTSDPRIDALIGAVQIFAQYHFSPGRPFRPYIKGGFGGYGLSLKEDNAEIQIEGGGVTFGGGFDYFFSPHFALGVDLTHNVIKYEEANLSAGGFSIGWEIDEEGSMTSLGLALAYYF